MPGVTTAYQSGVHGSRPAASAGCILYACSTHSLIYRSDGSTWTTWMTIGSTTTTVASDTIWDAAGDLAVGTGADTAAKLSLGAAGTAPVSTGSALAYAEILPWHISLIPMIWTADATTGTWALQPFTDNGVAYPLVQAGSVANGAAPNALINSSAAQNDAIAWDIVLAKGTWDCHFWVRKSSNTAIITLNQDTVSQGTVDTYAASAAAAKVSITGWTVATTGKHTMQLKAATKNASSASYIIELFAIEFRRTA